VGLAPNGEAEFKAPDWKVCNKYLRCGYLFTRIFCLKKIVSAPAAHQNVIFYMFKDLPANSAFFGKIFCKKWWQRGRFLRAEAEPSFIIYLYTPTR